jgi:hypothetical protein
MLPKTSWEQADELQTRCGMRSVQATVGWEVQLRFTFSRDDAFSGVTFSLIAKAIGCEPSLNYIFALEAPVRRSIAPVRGHLSHHVIARSTKKTAALVWSQ